METSQLIPFIRHIINEAATVADEFTIETDAALSEFVLAAMKQIVLLPGYQTIPVTIFPPAPRRPLLRHRQSTRRLPGTIKHQSRRMGDTGIYILTGNRQPLPGTVLIGQRGRQWASSASRFPGFPTRYHRRGPCSPHARHMRIPVHPAAVHRRRRRYPQLPGGEIPRMPGIHSSSTLSPVRKRIRRRQSRLRYRRSLHTVHQ